VITYPIVGSKVYIAQELLVQKFNQKSINENDDDITKLTRTHVGQGKSLPEVEQRHHKHTCLANR
jgi:hypothetical protein